MMSNEKPVGKKVVKSDSSVKPKQPKVDSTKGVTKINRVSK